MDTITMTAEELRLLKRRMYGIGYRKCACDLGAGMPVNEADLMEVYERIEDDGQRRVPDVRGHACDGRR